MARDALVGLLDLLVKFDELVHPEADENDVRLRLIRGSQRAGLQLREEEHVEQIGRDVARRRVAFALLLPEWL